MRPAHCITVVAPNWLGDAVMAMPMLGMLAAAGVRVSVYARPYTARVFAGTHEVGDVIAAPHGGRGARGGHLARSLRGIRPDAVIVLPPSFSSALSVLCSGVPIRVGQSAGGRRPLLSDAVGRASDRDDHLSNHYLALARRALDRCGVPVPDAWKPCVPFVTDRDRLEASRLLAGASDYVVVAPGAAYGPAKTWPRERFRAFMERIDGGMGVVLTGGPRDTALCADLAATRSGTLNLAGRTELGTFLALLERASAVVANDSGTPHVSAALGVPTVVLFGSTSPLWTRPLGKRVTVLQHVVHCNPCFRRRCPTQLECFNGIDPDDVLQAVAAAARK